MVKSDLLTLLNFVDKSNQMDLEFLFDITEDEKKILLDNQNYGKEIFKFMKNNKGKSYYNSVLDRLLNVKDYENNNVIDLILDIDSLDKGYYNYRLNILKGVNMPIYTYLLSAASSEYLIKSEYYEKILNTLKNTDSEITAEAIERLLYYLANKEFFKCAFDNLITLDGNDEVLINNFLNLALNSNFKDINLYTEVIQNYKNVKRDSIQLYNYIACNADLMKSTSNYLYMIKLIPTLSFEDLRKILLCIMPKKNLLNSSWFKYAIDTILKIEEPDEKYNEKARAISNILDNIDLLNSGQIIYTINKIFDRNDLNVLSNLLKKLLTKELIYSNNYRLALDKFLSMVSSTEALDNNKKSDVRNKFVNVLKNSNLINSKYYSQVVQKIYSINEDDLISYYINILTDKDVLESKYFDFVFNNLFNITDKYKLEVISKVFLDPNLINSNYYEYAILDVMKFSGELSKLSILSILLINKSLIESKYYKFAINTFLSSSNIEIYHLLIKDCLIALPFYKEIISKICEVKNPKILKLYVSLFSYYTINKLANKENIFKILDITDIDILNSFNTILKSEVDVYIFDYILPIALEIKDKEILKMFCNLVIYSNLINSNKCYYVVKTLSKILEMDKEILLLYLKLVTNKDLINVDIPTIVIDSFLTLAQTKDINLLNDYVDIITNKHLLKSQYYLNIVSILSNVINYKKIKLYKDLLNYHINPLFFYMIIMAKEKSSFNKYILNRKNVIDGNIIEILSNDNYQKSDINEILSDFSPDFDIKKDMHITYVKKGKR